MINNKKKHAHFGLRLQSDGGCSNHISDIHEKACKRLNMLRLLKHTIDKETLVKIYKYGFFQTYIVLVLHIYLFISALFNYCFFNGLGHENFILMFVCL